MWSSTAATVTVPVLAVRPAAMTSSAPVCWKCLPLAGDCALAVTVIVVSWLDAPLSVAVTPVEPPSSPMSSAPSASVTAGTASSSMMASCSAGGAVAPLPPVTVAVTSTALSGACTSLFTEVMVTVPVLSVWPAVMVSPTFAPRLKSLACAGATAAAATARIASSLAGCASRAVTVAASAFSPISAGATIRVTPGGPSSSKMVNSLAAGCDNR